MLRGREAVCGRLAAGLAGAGAGAARIALVAGGPGSGKTALCQDSMRRASEAGFRIVRVTGVEGEADLPLAGLSMLLRPLAAEFEELTEGLSSGQRRAVRAVAGLSNEVIIDRFTLGAATLGLLSAVAERRPLLVVIDDAHWLDGPSADALSFALRRLAADALMVLVATRPDHCPIALPEHTERVDIAGLSETDVAALLADAGLSVGAGVAEVIVAATGGLPLAVLETARALSPHQRGGEVALPEPLPIERKVTRVYRARLVGLPERSRRAVAIAATAGSAPTDMVRDALSDLGLALADLEPAEDAGVLSMRASGIHFTHPLLRAAALDLPTSGQRRAMHQALAAAAADPERRARHLVAAAAGPDERVAAALDAAATEVARRGGLAAAAPLLVQAAAFSAPGEPRYARLIAAARALGVAGQTQEAVRTGWEVLSGTTDPAQRADAALVIVDSSFWGPDIDSLVALASSEAARIAPLDRHRAVHALVQAAGAATVRGELTMGCKLTERAVELLDANTPARTRAVAEHMHASMLTLTGRHRQARAIFAGWTPPSPEDLSVAEIHGSRQPHNVQTLVRMGRYADAEALVRTLLAACNRESSPVAKAYVLATAGELLCWQGQWPRAMSLGDQSASLAEQTGQPALCGYVRASTARVLAAQGDQRRCRAYADAAITMERAHGYRPMRIHALAALGLLELGLGRAAAAAPLLVEADDIRRACGCGDPATVPFGADLIEALARSGHIREASVALTEHLAMAESCGTRWARATMARCQAMLAADPEQADTHFAAALELHPLEVPFDAARTRLCWGEHLRRRRAIAASREHLQDSLSVFERLGARPWADRAAAELRAAGRRPRAERSADLTALSPQELHCALAVVEGMSNRDAAAALFISAKTVEYHLHKAYTKLGITSRTQLARILGTTEDNGPHDPRRPRGTTH